MKNTAPRIIRSGRTWITPDGTVLPVISGADEPTDTQKAEAAKVSAEFELSELTDAQLTKLGEQRHQAILDAKSLDDVNAAKAAYELVRTEVQRRIDDAKSQSAAEALEAAKADVPEMPKADAKADAPADEAQAETTPDAQAADTTTDTGDTGDVEVAETSTPELEAIAAAANKVLAEGVTVDQDDAAKQASAEAESPARRPRLASAFRLTGGAGLPQGQETSVVEVIQKVTSTQASQSPKTVLASAPIVEDDADLLRSGSARDNERLVRRNLTALREFRRDTFSGDREARMAAMLASICPPLETVRTVLTAGTNATPASDEFSWLLSEGNGGNALGFEYRLPTSMSTVADGVGAWDEAKQAYVDPSDPETWKPVHAIDCPGFEEAVAEELTAAWEVDSWTELSSPGVVADVEFNIAKLWARYWEGFTLRALSTHARKVTFGPVHGTVADTIAVIRFLLSYATFDERLIPGDFSVFLPPGYVDLLVVDEARKGFQPTGYRAEDAVLAEIEAATGARIVKTLDLPLNANGSLATSPFQLANLPDVGDPAQALPAPWESQTFKIQLADPASLQPFQTNQATLGQQVTLDQARQNKRGMFQGQYLGFMKPGIAPIFEAEVSTIPCGVRAGLNDSCVPEDGNGDG